MTTLWRAMGPDGMVHGPGAVADALASKVEEPAQKRRLLEALDPVARLRLAMATLGIPAH